MLVGGGGDLKRQLGQHRQDALQLFSQAPISSLPPGCEKLVKPRRLKEDYQLINDTPQHRGLPQSLHHIHCVWDFT